MSSIGFPLPSSQDTDLNNDSDFSLDAPGPDRSRLKLPKLPRAEKPGISAVGKVIVASAALSGMIAAGVAHVAKVLSHSSIQSVAQPIRSAKPLKHIGSSDQVIVAEPK